MRRLAFAAAAFLGSAVAWTACTVEDLSYTGKTCTDTCPDGLRCIEGRCEEVASAAYVTDFRVDWATPNSVRWAWKLGGDGTKLVSYALDLTSPTPGAAGVRTWTSADNEELGGYEIKNSSGFDVVTGTITSELEPSTQYAARLTLRDVAGHTFQTGTVTAVTDVPRSPHLVVFDGSLRSGAFLIPDAPQFVVAGDGGLEGGPSLLYTVPQPTTGFQNLRVDSVDLLADAALTEKLFSTAAYLEFWIRGVGKAESSWSNIWIRTNAEDGGVCQDYAKCIYQYPADWLYHPDPTPPGRYRRVQIPLSQFALRNGDTEPIPGGALSRAVLLARTLYEVNVGCPYGATDRTTALDQVAIWW